MLLKLSVVFLPFLFFLDTSIASPWIDPNDLNLRNDIQLLADSGIITAPVTTYPIMWNAIKDDIMSVNTDLLSDEQVHALMHVKFSFKYVSRKRNITEQSVFIASNANRFTSYGNNNFDKGNLKTSNEFLSGNLAGKLQINYRIGLNSNSELNQGSDLNLDGSYLAYKLGNWVLSAGTIQRWWGPGIDTNLIMTTNSRPLPALSITRDNSKAFETPWLSWIGPWTLTAQMAQLEESRAVSNTLLWSARGTFRPINGLELGASWSLQWAGNGQPSSVGDFFKALTGGQECANGELDCDPSMLTQFGNHIAGFDARWSGKVFDLPYALYGQIIGEDSPDGGLITDKADLYGIETRFTLFDQRIMTNIEYTDTQVACAGRNSTYLNCYYEHGIYESGYRYYRRSLGSTYDNDAQTLVATFLIQTTSDNSWQVKLRKAQLNTDNIDRSPENINKGNTVSKIAEDIFQFDGQYKFIAFKSRFTLGVIVTNSSFINNVSNDNENEDKDGTEFDAYLKWEYRF